MSAEKLKVAEEAPIGEVKENGVVFWFNQVPYAYPKGTKFYASVIRAEAEKVAEAPDEALVREVAAQADANFYTPQLAAEWAIREYLKRREGK